MNIIKFEKNIDILSKILKKNNTNLSRFIFDSKLYIWGIKDSIDVVEKFQHKNDYILDFGCGTGFTSMSLASLGFKVKAIDVRTNNPEMIDEFKKKKDLQTNIWDSLSNKHLHFKYYNGVKIPYPNLSFDSVYAHAVIEHVPVKNLNKVLKEIKRVLKNKGKFYIFRTPRIQSYAEYLARKFNMGSHDVLVDEKELVKLLQQNNFRIISKKKTDFILANPPGFLLTVWNIICPLLYYFDKLLLFTPLQYFAHHIEIISEKEN